MPVTIELVDADSGSVVMMSTDCCGTCEQFWHRSLRAGGCRKRHTHVELSIDEHKCDEWVLKDKFRDAVMREIEGIL